MKDEGTLQFVSHLEHVKYKVRWELPLGEKGPSLSGKRGVSTGGPTGHRALEYPCRTGGPIRYRASVDVWISVVMSPDSLVVIFFSRNGNPLTCA